MVATLQQMQSDFETIRDELQEEFDNKSERWQEGEKGEAAQNELSEMESVDIESLIDALDGLASQYD